PLRPTPYSHTSRHFSFDYSVLCLQVRFYRPSLFFFFLLTPRPPRSTLFPYTTSSDLRPGGFAATRAGGQRRPRRPPSHQSLSAVSVLLPPGFARGDAAHARPASNGQLREDSPIGPPGWWLWPPSLR